MSQVIERVARTLYGDWSAPDQPDWQAWEAGNDLNGAGLTPDDFRETAIAVRDAVAKTLCLQNGQYECLRCTIESCSGEGFFEAADKLLA